MHKYLPVTLVGVISLLPAGCTRERAAPALAGPAEPAKVGRVTLRVEGMTKLQGIT
jgi:hypothetical protein